MKINYELWMYKFSPICFIETQVSINLFSSVNDEYITMQLLSRNLTENKF